MNEPMPKSKDRDRTTDSEKRNKRTSQNNAKPDNHHGKSSPRLEKSAERRSNSNQNPNSVSKYQENRSSRHGKTRSPNYTPQGNPRGGRNPRHGRSRSPRLERSRSPRRRRSRSPRRERSKSPRRVHSRSPGAGRNRSPHLGSKCSRRRRSRNREYLPMERTSSQRRCSNFRYYHISRGSSLEAEECKKECSNQSPYHQDEAEYQDEPEEQEDYKQSFHFADDEQPEEEPRFDDEEKFNMYLEDNQEIEHEEKPFKEEPQFNQSFQKDEMQLQQSFAKSAPNGAASVPADQSRQLEDLSIFSGDSNQSTLEWLQNFDDFANQKRWDNKMKVFHMPSKLTGFARNWYIGLENTNYQWYQWKQKIIKAFPCDQDYDKQLYYMLTRKKLNDETWEKFFGQKMAMLNACDITGRRAVACIIGGIRNKSTARDARRKNFESPEKLYEFLSQLPSLPPPEKKKAGCTQSEDPTRTEVVCAVEKTVCRICMEFGHDEAICTNRNALKMASKAMASFPVASRASDARTGFIENPYRPRPRNRRWKQGCQHCSGEDHILHKCPFVSEEKKVELYGEDALLAPDEISLIPIMFGCFRNTRCYTKFFIDVCVNGSILNGYIDPNFSEHVTIRQEEAVRLNLPVQKSYKMIHGYGNSNISTHGEVQVTIRADLAVGTVLAYVVPDHIQAIAVIVGKSFLNLPHVLLDAKGKKIQIRQNVLPPPEYPVNHTVVFQQPIVLEAPPQHYYSRMWPRAENPNQGENM